MVITKGGNNNVKNFRKFRNKYAKNAIKAFKRTFTNFPYSFLSFILSSIYWPKTTINYTIHSLDPFTRSFFESSARLATFKLEIIGWEWIENRK